MTLASESASGELTLDRDNLYLEETITDLRVGSLRRLTPINADGTSDTDREILYLGQAQVMSQMGALPISFQLEANSIEEAIEGFHQGAEKAAKEMMEQVQEMQRQQASQIVVPGSGRGFGTAGGLNPTGRVRSP